MLRPHRQSRLNESRFHGTLRASGCSWDVYFVEVSRLQADWLIECVVVGPRLHRVTVRCRSQVTHGDTARRVMAALRDWLVRGDDQEVAYLEVPGSLEKAS